MDIYGNYLLIGSNQRNVSPATTGSAYIYKYNGSTWNYIKKLPISDSVNNDEYGYAVAINDTFAFVSSAKHDNNKGAVILIDFSYRRSAVSGPNPRPSYRYRCSPRACVC